MKLFFQVFNQWRYWIFETVLAFATRNCTNHSQKDHKIRSSSSKSRCPLWWSQRRRRQTTVQKSRTVWWTRQKGRCRSRSCWFGTCKLYSFCFYIDNLSESRYIDLNAILGIRQNCFVKPKMALNYLYFEREVRTSVLSIGLPSSMNAFTVKFDFHPFLWNF